MNTRLRTPQEYEFTVAFGMWADRIREAYESLLHNCGVKDTDTPSWGLHFFMMKAYAEATE